MPDVLFSSRIALINQMETRYNETVFRFRIKTKRPQIVKRSVK